MINWLACWLISIIIWQILLPMILTSSKKPGLIISTSSSSWQFHLISRILRGRQICYPRTFKVSRNSQSKLTPLSNSRWALLRSKREVPPFFHFTKTTFSSWHTTAHWPRKKKNSLCSWSFLPCRVIFKNAPFPPLLWHYFDLTQNNFPPVKLAFTIPRNVVI